MVNNLILYDLSPLSEAKEDNNSIYAPLLRQVIVLFKLMAKNFDLLVMSTCALNYNQLENFFTTVVCRGY